MAEARVAAFRYEADGSQAIAETEKLRKKVQQLDDTKLDGVGKNFSSLFASLRGGPATITAVLTSLGAFKAINFADEIGDAADMIGVAASTLSKLRFVAEQTDVSFEALSSGISFFQKNLSKAAEDGGALANVVSDLGLNVNTLRSLSLEEQLTAFAEGFSKVSDQTDKARISAVAFGRGAGTEFIPLLDRGAEGFEKLTDRAEELGAVLNDQASGNIDRFLKKLAELGTVAKTQGANAIGNFLGQVGFGGNEVGDLEAQLKQLELIRQNEKFVRDPLLGDRERQGAERFAATKTDLEIEKLKTRISLLKEAEFLLNKNDTPGSLSAVEAISAPKLAEQFDPELVAAKKAEDEAKRQQELKDALINNLQDISDNQVAINRKTEEEITAIVEGESERRAQIEQNIRDATRQREAALQQEILAIRQQATLSATTLLTAYGGKFAAVGKAILLVEKALAIKAAFINTKEAVTKTLAKYGGTPVGYAAAAAVAALGAVNIAAIAAQGLDGPGSVGGLSGTGNAAFDRPPTNSNDDSNQIPATLTQPTVTQVIINGSVFSGQETADFLVEVIRDAVNNKDVTIINANSAQAQQIRG